MRHDGLLTPDDLGLSTDLYQLTMAAAFFEAGLEGRTATFEVAVRSLPAQRGYLIAAGLEQAVHYLEHLRFAPDVIDWLATTGHFREPFLAYLGDLRFRGDVAALPEGTAYFPPGPMLQVTAPIVQAQLAETYLLTTLTFQTMIASKAARVVDAAGGRAVFDFSSRRDHGPQAGLLAARAAYLGGCVGSSNVLAQRRFGVPALGTMAHSFVMFHDSELAAMRAFCHASPGDPTLLIDTYDTLQGARLAVTIDAELRAQGRRLAAVRLDSGDLVAMSFAVRGILDAAGCTDVRIVASGNLDEYEIARLLRAGAPIDAFGVGTALGTGGDAPSLNSTYKLVSRTGEAGRETATSKLSDGKPSLPGRKQVWRQRDAAGALVGDTLALHDETLPGEPLLQAVMRDGTPLAAPPSLADSRARAAAQVAALPPAVRDLRNPAIYPVRRSPGLDALERRLRARSPERL